MTKTESIAGAIVDFAKSRYGQEQIPLHRPVFEGNERQYMTKCIDSNFVSSVGAMVTEFEEQMAAFCGAKYAVATVNGTAALHTSLLVCGVERSTDTLPSTHVRSDCQRNKLHRRNARLHRCGQRHSGHEPSGPACLVGSKF